MSKAAATSSTSTIKDQLSEKLELYKKYFSIITADKEAKEKLAKSQEQSETAQESITAEIAKLSKRITEANKVVKELKYAIAELIGGQDKVFIYLSNISEAISSEFAMEINTIITKGADLNKKLKSALVQEISNLYGLNAENVNIEPKEIGKQDGFIVTDKASGLKLFTKASKIFGDDTKSIDPRELFAYKVLEHMDLGPETRYIITAGSSNPSGAKICYIVTKDAAYSESDIKRVFFTDNYITKDKPHNEALDHWENSLKNKDFRTKFLALSIVNDLLHLNDSLATNAENYGPILERSSKTANIQYKAILVDHQVKSSMFKFEPAKHPILSLIEKLQINASKKNVTGELISYKIIQDKGYFVDSKQTREELLEAIKIIHTTLLQAISTATKEINDEVSKSKESFSTRAYITFTEYLTQTEENIKVFSSLQDRYVTDVDNACKVVSDLLQKDQQVKGEDFGNEDGLYLQDIEHNLSLIQNQDTNSNILSKAIGLGSLSLYYEEKQHLFIINPEGPSSKFNEELVKYQHHNSNTHIINANIQRDNFTCADHCLILLASIINNQRDINFDKLGIVIVSSQYGNHANLFIVSTHPNANMIIENCISTYKESIDLYETNYFNCNLPLLIDTFTPHPCKEEDMFINLAQLLGDNSENALALESFHRAE